MEEEKEAELLRLIDRPRMPRNPFIQYESEETTTGDVERSSSALSIDAIDDVCPLSNGGMEFALGSSPPPLQFCDFFIGTGIAVDPDPHSFFLMDPDPHIECGSGSRRES